MWRNKDLLINNGNNDSWRVNELTYLRIVTGRERVAGFRFSAGFNLSNAVK